jgi:DNA-binding CsgD family transcriptional regulator
MAPVQVFLQRTSASWSCGATLRAVDEARDALVLACGDELLEVQSLDALGAALWSRGELHHAAVALGAAERLREASGHARPPDGVAELATASPGYQEGRRLNPTEVLAELARRRSARGRPTSGWDSLTPGERQVVELALDGLSNPRIAQRLFLSTNTVKTHLLRAYRKLGVNSRRDLSSVRR